MKKLLLTAMSVAVVLTAAAAGPKPMTKSDLAQMTKKERVRPVMVQKQIVPKAMWPKAAMATAAERMRAPKKADGIVTASYLRPRGCFFQSGTTTGYGSYASSIFVPPYKDVPFGGISEGATSSYWDVQYVDVNDEGTAYVRKWARAEGDTVICNWMEETDTIPRFTATDGTNQATYFINGFYNNKEYSSYINSISYYNEEEDETYGETYAAASYYALRPRVPTTAGWENYSNASIGIAGGEDWEAWFGKNAQGIDFVAVGFEKPLYPYAVKKAVIDYSGIITADTELQMAIIKVKEQPSEASNWTAILGDTIATATGILPASADQINGGDGYVEFYFKEIEGEMVYDIEPEIDDDIVVVLTGYNAETVKEFTLSIPTDNMGDNYVTAGYLGHISSQTEEMELISLEHFFSSLVVKSAPSIFLDVTMPFLTYYYNAEDGEYTFPDEGGSISKTFGTKVVEGIEVYSYLGSDNWDILTAGGDEIPEWLTIETEDQVYAETSASAGEFNNLVVVNVTADALPEGVQGRECYIKFSYPGASLIYHVIQGVLPEFYVSGDFNEWATAEALKMDKDIKTGKFDAEVELEEGGEFKIVSPDGDNWIWYGGIDEMQVGHFLVTNDLLGTEINLVDGSNFKVEKAGTYKLIVDPETMTIVVEREKAVGIVGDVNGDGEVSIADLTMLASLVSEDSSNERSDVNGDGETSVADITTLVSILMSQN